ncbi:hybrid sensor histidine kinase/response regulator [Alteromonas sp. a30]|uniref:hybrid sensor histidine kinase/response regulator n=1 Tax=Alteromonas sp. a30 TaxID=2730917 RepID=UPI00227FAE7C|nr:hybrid sensor histidine kinase/response regulator [Alteromonas sp. a30]MCY7297084.1 response regulator [Alteromonas sp. a30]
MKWSISTKFLIPMGVVFVAFFFAQYYLINSSTQQILLDKAQSRALDMADAAVLALEADLKDSNFVRVASSLATSEDVDFVIFIDKRKEQIIASSSFKYRKKIEELPSDLKRRVQYAMNITQWQFLHLGNNDFWFSYNIRTIPVGENRIHTYLMLTKWSGDSVNRAIEEARYIHFTYLALGCFGMAVLGYMLFRHVTLKPLDRLINSIRKRQAGMPYENLPISSRDEFEELSTSLCQMAEIERESIESIVRSKKKAEDIAALKSAFLANMSHEIRTPINGILGLVQVAQESRNPDKNQQYLQKIFLSGQTLIGIINDILDFSKLAAGKVSIENIEFCPDQLIEQVFELCQNNADKKDIKLVTRLAPDLPLTLCSDPLRLHQILLNLVNNAVKFTENGVVSINMETEFRDEKLWLLVKVVDTGIGIPEEKCAQLFEEFVQVDGSTTRKYGGTGLGLTISKNLVGLMGGEIGVRSEVGRGSSFHFEVPVEVATEMQLQKKLKEVLALIRVESDLLDTSSLSNPMVSLVKRLEAFGRGERRVCLCSMPQYLSYGTGNDAFTVILGADDWTDKPLEGDVHPLYSQVNRESLINLLYKNIVDTGEVEERNENALLPQEGETQHGVYKILLVEDNDINAEVIIGMLAGNQLEIHHVENGAEAVAFLRESSVDLILMDVQMPIMDGYLASKTIREELSLLTPIIGLSANVLPEEIEKAKAHGMDDYLSKPVIKKSLYNKIQQWLSHRSI